MDLQKILQNMGLEEKEAKVYLALLQEGETTATKLSELTSLDRTLMYQLTNKLIEKGFASYIIKEKVRFFLAADPIIFLKNLREKEELLKRALPELKAKQLLEKQETKVEVYRGRKGIYAMLKLVISNDSRYYCMGGMSEACTRFENETIKIVQEAENIKSHGKILARKKDYLILGKREELRFVPDELLSSTSIMVSGKKTVIFVWTEPYYAVLIENEEIAKGNLATFNYLWSIAKKASKKEIKKRLVKK
ncbi:MAG: helix-turn-helix domain-containing protein [Nanoarchaeota archaeon]|nr:helix-turn-helix domain-containing protein [Nanoarchaeota archaeon]